MAAFLAEIEPDYERHLDPIEKKQRLVLAVRGKWPSMTAPEASAIKSENWNVTAEVTGFPA